MYPPKREVRGGESLPMPSQASSPFLCVHTILEVANQVPPPGLAPGTQEINIQSSTPRTNQSVKEPATYYAVGQRGRGQI